jgi:hypothetical protein
MKTLSFFIASILCFMFLLSCNKQTKESREPEPKHFKTTDMLTSTPQCAETEMILLHNNMIPSNNGALSMVGASITFNRISALQIKPYSKEDIDCCTIIYQAPTKENFTSELKDVYHQSPWFWIKPQNVIICHDVKEGDEQWARLETFEKGTFRLEVHVSSLDCIK